MKTKSIILIAISLGFGLVAALGMTHLMARNSAKVTPEIQEISVLVAKEDVKVGEELTADKVIMKKFRPGSVPENSARALEEIEGMRSNGNFSKGNFIPKELLVEKGKYMVTTIPKGYTVVSTKPDLESTAHNSLNPGDRIDIIAILRHPQTGQQIAKTFLKNIKVYGINARTTRVHQDEPVNIRIVQVLVRPRQAEALALVESVGKLRFVRIGGVETVTELEDEEYEDESDSGTVSIAALFNEGGKTDPAQAAMLAEIRRRENEFQSKLDAEEKRRNDLKRPFVMRIEGSQGPVEYVWTDRGAMPAMREMEGRNGNSISMPEPAHKELPPEAPKTPDTYPPEKIEASEVNL